VNFLGYAIGFTLIPSILMFYGRLLGKGWLVVCGWILFVLAYSAVIERGAPEAAFFLAFVVCIAVTVLVRPAAPKPPTNP
jgi:hypothetical protein